MSRQVAQNIETCIHGGGKVVSIQNSRNVSERNLCPLCIIGYEFAYSFHVVQEIEP